MEEKKLTDEEIVAKYIEQYEEYKKYGSVVEKVSPKLIIDLIQRLQSEIKYKTECYDELQRQVDELEEELEKAYITERGNIQAEIADCGAPCHWCRDLIVEDTAKEILQELWEETEPIENDEWAREKIKEIAKRKGVEVE